MHLDFFITFFVIIHIIFFLSLQYNIVSNLKFHFSSRVLQGRIWRAFRAFPGRPWHRTQDSVRHKTDDKKREKNEWEKGKMCKEKKWKKEREKMDRNKQIKIKKCTETRTEILTR